MNKIDDGGHLYPHEWRFSDETVERSDGVTCRNDIAKAAMQSHIIYTGIAMMMLSCSDDHSEEAKGALEIYIRKMNPTEVAKSAYMIADAMIAEGKKND